MAEDEEKKKKIPEYYIYKNRLGSGMIDLNYVVNVECGSYMGVTNMIHTIIIVSMFGNTTLEFFEEGVRDVEFQNIVEILIELTGGNYHNKTF